MSVGHPRPHICGSTPGEGHMDRALSMGASARPMAGLDSAPCTTSVGVFSELWGRQSLGSCRGPAFWSGGKPRSTRTVPSPCGRPSSVPAGCGPLTSSELGTGRSGLEERTGGRTSSGTSCWSVPYPMGWNWTTCAGSVTASGRNTLRRSPTLRTCDVGSTLGRRNACEGMTSPIRPTLCLTPGAFVNAEPASISIDVRGICAPASSGAVAHG